MEDEYLKKENKKGRKVTDCFLTEFESLKGEGVSEMQDASPVIMKVF